MYAISIFVFFLAIVLNGCLATPLDDYVNTPDPIFSWKRLQTYTESSHTLYILNMTSQKWFDESLSSQPIWWYYIAITVPRTVRRGLTAFLNINGGDNTDSKFWSGDLSNDSSKIEPTSNPMTSLAVNTGSITATIWQIPNQPFRFWTDPLNKSRVEDALIAWTWKEYLDTNGTDPRILLRFPMTKAAVRAMDTVQQFLQQQQLVVPQKFVVGGISKRGWTAWITAAVDNIRVVGAVPLVMDSLNLRPNMMSHYRSLGGWTFLFDDYHEMNLTFHLDDPYLTKLAEMIDPYSYFDRYSKTKIFQLQGAGDEFFLPDSEDFFWNPLQVATGGSYLRRIPNTGHGIQGYEESLESFFLSVADDTPLPSMTWTRSDDGARGIIRVVIDFSAGKPRPIVVSGYQVRTSDTLRRDFRQAKLDKNTGRPIANPIVWTNIGVQYEGENGSTVSYSLVIPIPSDGHWIAALVQAEFPGPDGTRLTLTTETLILPNTYPVEVCRDPGCYGELV